MELEKIFCKVLSLDLAAIVAVALVLIARLCFLKAPKRCSYFLWSVVLLRLVIPFSLKLPGKSLLPVSTDTFSTDLAFKAVPVIDSGNRMVDSAVNSILPAAEVGASANPMQIWLAVGTVVWIAGMTLLAALSLVKYFRLMLLIGTESQSNIAVSDKIETAFVIGIFRPVICLPTGLSESERRMIIAHESAHIKRGDHIVKLISYILLVIHWYNPVMWIAFGLMTRDMEMSCDEAVINGGCDRSDYAEALLRLSVGKEILPAIPPTFGEGAVKERIVNVMKCNVSNTFVSFIAIIAAALIAVTCVVTGTASQKTTVSFDATDSATGFGISLKLPDGWKIGDGSESYRPGITESALTITDKDGNEIGALGTSFYTDYSQFDDPQYPEPFSPNYYQCVYPELRLAAHCIWEIDPATSIRTDVGETMLAGIYVHIPEEGVPAVEWEFVESKGIVSYDDSKHVYTFISFRTSEYDISDETIKEIAESLEFVPENNT